MATSTPSPWDDSPLSRQVARDRDTVGPGRAASNGHERAVSGGVTLLHHECDKPRGGWSPGQVLDRHGLVFVRRGGFHRRLDGREAFAGPSMAYFELAGTEMQVAHPGPDGDSTSVYFLDATVLERLCGPADLPQAPVVVGGVVDLAQRRLAAAVEDRVDDLAIDEGLTRLVGDVLALVDERRALRCRRETEEAHRRIVLHAAEAISADPASASLTAIAADVAHSPYHVSRVFHRETGMTMTRFRNVVRTGIAIERLSQGERDLVGMALDLGFHDQAHMTRVIRAHTGVPPGRIRTLLAQSSAA
jgi:AraC-like DNA-binding protein